MSALIRIRARFPTSIRICFTRAASSARASSTTWGRVSLSRHSPAALLKTPCSATTFSKGPTPVPDSARIPTSLTTTRRTTSRSRHGCTGGYRATGRSFAGSGEPFRTSSVSRFPTRSLPYRDGRFSTTSGAACSLPRSSCCSWRAGRCSRARAWCGQWWGCWCSPFRPTSRSAARYRVASAAYLSASTYWPSATRSSPAHARRCSQRSSCSIRAG